MYVAGALWEDERNGQLTNSSTTGECQATGDSFVLPRDAGRLFASRSLASFREKKLETGKIEKTTRAATRKLSDGDAEKLNIASQGGEEGGREGGCREVSHYQRSRT